MKKKLALAILVFVLAFGAVFSMTACNDSSGTGTGSGNATTDSAISTGGIEEEAEEELIDSGDPTAVTGTWKLTSIKVEDKKLDKSQLKEFDYLYVFHNSIADVTIDGVSHKSMAYVFENDEVRFGSEILESYGLIFQKNKLVLTISINEREGKLYFEKQ